MLIRALPAEAPLWAELQAEREVAQKPTDEVLRSRQAEWEARNEAQRQKEAAGV